MAQKKYYAAQTPEAKLVALQEMKSTAPSHKGAENLRAEINRKISVLRNDLEKQKLQQSKRGSAPSLSIKKDGIGQVAILGLPNTGKSWLLNKLVRKQIVEETPYPFATMIPVPAMLDYHGARIQLIEVPAILEGSSSGKAQGKEIIAIARSADSLIVLGSKEEQEIVVDELKKANIFLNKKRPAIFVKNSEFRGIQITGKNLLKFPFNQLEGYLKSVGFTNSSVIVSEPILSLSQVAEALNEKIVYKKAILVDARKVSDFSLSDLSDQIFLLLDKILVYTKRPGQEPDMNKPIALEKGSTLLELARIVHKDFAKNLKFARVWGSTKFPGQRVGPDYILKNRDVVEIAI